VRRTAAHDSGVERRKGCRQLPEPVPSSRASAVSGLRLLTEPATLRSPRTVLCKTLICNRANVSAAGLSADRPKPVGSWASYAGGPLPPPGSCVKTGAGNLLQWWSAVCFTIRGRGTLLSNSKHFPKESVHLPLSTVPLKESMLGLKAV
jgi:hypothetical protein